MSDFTSRANLRLPGGGSTGTILPDEQVDIDVLNDNFRKIDALLGARNIPSASSYSGSMDGDLVYARDTEYLHMFSTTAGGLITPRLPGARQYSGTAAERVAFAPQAKDGDLWRDTDNIGVIWVYKAGSPGTWEYTGNPLRGTKAAMDQLVTDGRAVVGMKCYNVDDNSDYTYLGGLWVGGFATVGLGSGYILASSKVVRDGSMVVANIKTTRASTQTTNGAVWFTLPAGFRPPDQIEAACFTTGGTGGALPQLAQIGSNGECRMWFVTTPTAGSATTQSLSVAFAIQ